MSQDDEQELTLSQATSLIEELKRDLAQMRMSEEGWHYFERMHAQARAHRERIESNASGSLDPNLEVLRYLELELRGILERTRGVLH